MRSQSRLLAALLPSRALTAVRSPSKNQGRKRRHIGAHQAVAGRLRTIRQYLVPQHTGPILMSFLCVTRRDVYRYLGRLQRNAASADPKWRRGRRDWVWQPFWSSNSTRVEEQP